MKGEKNHAKAGILRLLLVTCLVLFLQGIIVEGRFAVKDYADGEKSAVEYLYAGFRQQLSFTWRVFCFPVMDFREMTSQKGKILL